MTPTGRAEAVRQAIRAVEKASQTAAGIYSTGESVLALLNTKGVFAYHAETMGQFSITAMAQDSSGWAKKSSCNAAELKPLDFARIAAKKAADSRAPEEIAPGPYTVVLEPSPWPELLRQ